MTQTAEYEAAYRQLADAVEALHRLAEQANPEPPAVATDWVLLVGAMYIDDESGQRGGVVEVYPRDGSQPAYITTGLVIAAAQLVNK